MFWQYRHARSQCKMDITGFIVSGGTQRCPDRPKLLQLHFVPNMTLILVTELCSAYHFIYRGLRIHSADISEVDNAMTALKFDRLATDHFSNSDCTPPGTHKYLVNQPTYSLSRR
jgi:hypothetical protein